MNIRLAKKLDFKAVSKLLLKMFDDFLAPYFTKKSAKIFKEHKLSEESLNDRLDHLMFVAEEKEEIIGFIESYKNNLWLFFVDKKYHRRGIGESLINKLSTSLKKLGFKSIYVQASPQAIPVYLKIGFKKTTGERVKNGRRYQPMKKNLN